MHCFPTFCLYTVVAAVFFMLFVILASIPLVLGIDVNCSKISSFLNSHNSIFIFLLSCFSVYLPIMCCIHFLRITKNFVTSVQCFSQNTNAHEFQGNYSREILGLSILLKNELIDEIYGKTESVKFYNTQIETLEISREQACKRTLIQFFSKTEGFDFIHCMHIYLT